MVSVNGYYDGNVCVLTDSVSEQAVLAIIRPDLENKGTPATFL